MINHILKYYYYTSFIHQNIHNSNSTLNNKKKSNNSNPKQLEQKITNKQSNKNLSNSKITIKCLTDHQNYSKKLSKTILTESYRKQKEVCKDLTHEMRNERNNVEEWHIKRNEKIFAKTGKNGTKCLVPRVAVAFQPYTHEREVQGMFKSTHLQYNITISTLKKLGMIHNHFTTINTQNTTIISNIKAKSITSINTSKSINSINQIKQITNLNIRSLNNK